jgi:hypothetical protein
LAEEAAVGSALFALELARRFAVFEDFFDEVFDRALGIRAPLDGGSGALSLRQTETYSNAATRRSGEARAIHRFMHRRDCLAVPIAREAVTKLRTAAWRAAASFEET